MTQDENQGTIVDCLPTEILLYILTFLPAKQLVRLRQVCQRWRNIIDGIICSDPFWLNHCRRDYDNVYKVARYKSRVGMLWFNIYRSLSLWRHLGHAREIRDEFSSASCINDEIQDMQVLQDGTIAVHKHGKIVFYDIETMEPSKRRVITGDYLQYTENDDVILIRSYHLNLYVIRKNNQNPNYEANATFDDVKMTLPIDKEVYFVTLNNDIYICKFGEGVITSRLLKHSDESIMCLSYIDKLYYLTCQRNIYSFTQNRAVLVCRLDDKPNLLHELYKYSFLESVDWRIVLQWMYLLHRKIPEGPLQEIMTVKVYGDVVFVGCGWGVFRIYYAPFTDGEFDLHNAEPVKQYNFMERSDCPVLTTCPIIRVDALEAEDGHTVVVAMPKKIGVVHFTHTFKRTATVAMLPYSDVQRVKVLRMEDI